MTGSYVRCASLALAVALTALGCDKDSKAGDRCGSSVPPLASAGADLTVSPGVRVDLAGSVSAVPGATVTYEWRLASRPVGSSATLSSITASETSFVADIAGAYAVTLTVADGCARSEPDIVVVNAVGGSPGCAGIPPPVANAGQDQGSSLNTSVYLSGAWSTSSRFGGLSYRWTLVSRPAGSSAQLAGTTGVSTAISPDVEGEYVASLVVNDGCADSAADLVKVTAGNRSPSAVAGPDRSVPTGAEVTVDGSASSDPEHQPLSYTWTLTSRPAGSAAQLSGTGATRRFTPDLDGPYELVLVVSDGARESTPDSLILTAANLAPVAEAGPDLAANAGNTVSLDGRASRDPNGAPLTYAWTLTKPAGSAATLDDPTTSTPAFVADVEGVYGATLVVSDGTSSSSDSVTITVYAPVSLLARHVTDAEYSRGLDRIVLVSGEPNELAIHDPVTGSEKVVALPLPPQCVSVSADGLFAAVGHNALISYVNLSTGTLVKTLATSADVFDVVLAPNGYAHAFPRIDQWVEIHSVEIATGKETLSGGWSIRAGTRAKLHPGGTSMYGADNGLSPADIEKYGISGGTAQFLYDSPYHGDYAMCGDLWISEDGARIFTRCGNVFRAATLQADDMRYAGSLAPSGRTVTTRWVEDSIAANAIAVLTDVSWSGGDDTKMYLHERSYMARTATVTLPKIAVGGTAFASHGRFVFHRSDGTERYVLLQVDAASGLLADYALFVH